MKIIEVIPIAKGMTRDALSYFYRDEIPEGALVSIPLRNKIRPALVIGSKEARIEKTSIKRSAFSLKKIKSIEHESFFRPEFLRAVKKSAEYFATSTGSVLSLFLSEKLFDTIDTLTPPSFKTTSEKKSSGNARLVSGTDEERFSFYKSFIREQFAKKRSVLFVLPTVHDVRRYATYFSRGIENATFTLHGYKKKSDLVKTWNAASTLPRPIVLFTTPKFISLPRHDFHTIILEHESSGAFQNQTRPYIDIRHVVEVYAKEIGADYFLGDLCPSLETLYRAEEEFLTPLKDPFARIQFSSKAEIIGMKKVKANPKKTFSSLSKELVTLLPIVKEKSLHVLIFAARRGIASQTVCGDCGAMVLCKKCHAPVVLHKDTETKEKTVFVCHRCGTKRSTEERCRTCQSWKLTPLGIGIERVIDDVKENFPELPLFQLDKDSVKNQKEALSVRDAFLKEPGAVLVGTEMLFPFFEAPVDYTVIASIDSLFSIPDYRITEKIFSILVRLRFLAREKMLVQTRTEEEPIIASALSGNIREYYKNEITLRKQFGYPPFGHFIKMTLRGKNESFLTTTFSELENYLARKFISQGEIRKDIRGNVYSSQLLHFENKEWPDYVLLEKLKSLGIGYKIQIDPEHLL